MKNKMPEHIEEYFATIEGSKESINARELFQADDNIDLKTHLNDREIALITTLFFNNDLLIAHGLQPVFKDYVKNFMRLKVSKDRLSRQEFVSINKKDDVEDSLNTMSNISNIIGSKK